MGTHARALSQDGWTALMLAASRDRVDCVRLLLDAGADKEAKNDVRASAVVWEGALLLMVVMFWLCLEHAIPSLFLFLIFEVLIIFFE
jgi:ankyrin repeat protein